MTEDRLFREAVDAGDRDGDIVASLRCQLRQLVDRYDVSYAVCNRLFEGLTAHLQQLSESRGSPTRSRLNANGVAFQWSTNLGGYPAIRFVVDPAPPDPSYARRIEDTIALLQMCVPTSIGVQLADVVRGFAVPASENNDRAPIAAWVGVSVNQCGAVAVKAYVGQLPGDPTTSFERFGRQLRDLGGQSSLTRLTAMVPLLVPSLMPVALAVESMDGRLTRLKMYSRPHAVDFGALGALEHLIGERAGADFRGVVNRLAPLGRFPPEAVIPSLEFGLLQEGHGVKVDFDLGILVADDVAADEVVQELCTCLRLSTERHEHIMGILRRYCGDSSRAIALVGAAFRGSGTSLDVYYQPAWPGRI